MKRQRLVTKSDYWFKMISGLGSKAFASNSITWELSFFGLEK